MSTLKRYPSYRDSGILWLGQIPAHWKVKRLKFLASVNPSKTEINYLPKSLEISFLPMELVGEGFLQSDNTKTLGDVGQGFTYFQDGDVVIAKITPSFENGKGAIATNLINGIGFGTTELHVVRPTKQLDKRFLYYLTISRNFRHMGAGMMQGTAGQKRVPDSFLINYPIAYPLIPEQQAIAAFLDRATARIDALVAKKQRLLDLLAEKRAALISQAVTKGNALNNSIKDRCPAPWLFPLPSGWRRQPLKYISFTKGRIGYENLRSEEYTEDGPYLVSSVHFRDGKIEWESCNHVTRERFEMAPEIILQKNDVLFMKDGAMMGKLAYVDDLPSDACLNSHILLIRPLHGGYLPKFLLYVLMTSVYKAYMEQMAKGTTFLGFSEQSMGNFPLSLPPISEQKEICDHIDNKLQHIDDLVRKTNDVIEHLREYRSTLISSAVTGKIKIL